MSYIHSIVIFIWTHSVCIQRNTCLSSLSWSQSSSISQLSSKYNMAAGVYGNTVWLFGGQGGTERDIIKINLDTQGVTTSSTSFDYAGGGQMYCQSGSVLFMADPDESNIIGYDLSSNSIAYFITKHNAPSSDRCCIAANANYLFRTGGNSGGPTKAYFIYRFSDQSWIASSNQASLSRKEHSCEIVNGKLYNIGGYKTSTAQAKVIEYFDIVDPYSGSWSTFSGQLVKSRSQARSVVHDDRYIYLVGGYDGFTSSQLKSIELIDTVGGSVLTDSSMLRVKKNAGVVLYNYRVYVLGGYTVTSNAYYQIGSGIPTPQPTSMPTERPTSNPTSSPSSPSMPPTSTSISPTSPPSSFTSNPTSSPSSASTPPTSAPSLAPTMAPSNAPTTSPSNAPTLAPSFVPTSITSAPTRTPTPAPSSGSAAPTSAPSSPPSTAPTSAPSNAPTSAPTRVPSAAPSNAPTFSPTNAPSLAPSNEPTSAPSNEPTYSPTHVPSTAPSTAPTFSPTGAPSLAPSTAPTSAPSNEPTYSPTHVPSTAPSTAPTFSPTGAPSLAPSNAPTQCLDYFDYKSLDGIDVIHEMQSEHPFLYENQSFPSNATVQRHISSEHEHRFVDEVIVCDNSDSNDDICFIGCYDVGHCILADVHSALGTTWAEIRLICGRKACKHLVFNISDTDLGALTVLCAEEFACHGLELNIEATSDMVILIECSVSFSCRDMMVYLMHEEPERPTTAITANINCYYDHSCDDMTITTDESPFIFINLHAMRHSDEITINYHLWRNIKVHCGSDSDRRYMRYDTRNLLDEYEVLELARDEYHARKLPCEDIVVDCSDNAQFDRQCEYKYALSNVSLGDILKEQSKPHCYWMDIGQLYKATCEGTCADAMEYHQYNKTFDLDMYFESDAYDDSNDDEDDAQNTTKSYAVCKEYFGSKNDTEESLSSIDTIFSYVLNLMRSGTGDNFIIHDILLPPLTILRDGLQQMECQNADINRIKIRCNVVIDSAETRERVIDDLFDADSQFVTTSAVLLSELFGIPISIQRVNPQFVTTLEGIDKKVVMAIVLGSVCVVGSILLVVIRARRKRRARLEALTTYIHNPMVIFVGIAVYEERPDDPQVEGHFRDLGGIDVDSRHVTELFGDKLNYDVFPKQLKVQWTLNEMMEFLKDKADSLESNVNTVYDGLLVVLSCHGVTDNVVTSDYQTIKKSAIHRLFTSDKPENRQIPRLFIYDCCDGADDYEIGTFRCESENESESREVAIAHAVPKSSTKEECDTVTLQSKGTKNARRRGDIRQTSTVQHKGSKNARHQSDVRQTSARVAGEDEVKIQHKNVEFATISGQTDGLWLHNEQNPDFRLVTIHAANEGFQSKLDIVTGSYVVTAFTEKMSDNVDNENKKWLFEICDDIQSELHSQGKQHTVNTFNDNMRYLKFLRNDGTGGCIQNTNGDNVIAGEEIATTQQPKGSKNARHQSDLRQTSTTQAKGSKNARHRADARQTSSQNEMKQWLKQIEMEQYYTDFEKHGYNTIESLSSIDEDALTLMNIETTAHRKTILNAVADTLN
eukprot:940870_1